MEPGSIRSIVERLAHWCRQHERGLAARDAVGERPHRRPLHRAWIVLLDVRFERGRRAHDPPDLHGVARLEHDVAPEEALLGHGADR